ncbi:MAG: ABC transporter ATP-binding protein [Acidipila sp.]|nr:ABC transporter ATP-binding protein [Acidipila sp.]
MSKQYSQRRPLNGEKFIIHALKNVNLTIARGATLAIIGESGAGKSTLARCLALLEEPTQGEIHFEGSNLLTLGRKNLIPIRRRIQLIFQDPASALNPRFTAEEIIAEPMLVQGLSTKTQRRQRVSELFDEVGLPAQCGQKRPSEFSGGQRQRLAIARALALRPALLILDEALSHLDVANQQLIVQLLADLQSAHSLTYLHISHDVRMVSKFADEIAVMHDGAIVELRPATQLRAHPAHFPTGELVRATPALTSVRQGRFPRQAP